MVKFSIIIVSYNVKYILEQCLCSVKKAIPAANKPGPITPHPMINGEFDAEVLVIDNDSSDGSIEYLKPLFPFVRFISNKENTGFAKGNNQALAIAEGEYILFLNPDTILPEDFFLKCIPFMNTNPGIGAIGVHMIDGAGHFLKESKRGFPTSWASFCKLWGLTALFPQSKLFAKYYLGHLDEKTSHEVEALSGACMLVKKELLDKTGGFDERFFMYAEDIDLSLQIQRLGYKNFYLAETTIIHFKGESTTKDLRYVKLFYKAMIQFVEKHYTGTRGRLYAGFLRMGIGVRGLLAFGNLGLKKNTMKPRFRDHKTFFLGDDSSINEAKELKRELADFAQNSDEANEIILCEGENFSFRNLIETMRCSPGKNYRIHAQNSSGIIGSSDS